MILRKLSPILSSLLKSKKSLFLLGPRQTGKSTLLKALKVAAYINLSQNKDRQRYEKNPDLLTQEVSALRDQHKFPLIIIDEIQKAPALLDESQELIDNKLAQFIFTGSSARKIKKRGLINLLPGRFLTLKMTGLSLSEIPDLKNYKVEDALNYGSLPEIFLTKDLKIKKKLLASYSEMYLEEEVRAEALVRNVANYAQFLELAALEAGKLVSFNALSQQIGVAQTTIANYYEILEDCLIIERISPITATSHRKKLARSNRYLFFDMGVRRITAREGTQPHPERKGELFEHFIGLEVLKYLYQTDSSSELRFWRDNDGPEVDWVVITDQKYLPIEVKLKSNPNLSDAKHLNTFMNEYDSPNGGLVVCSTPKKFKINDRITAINWKDLPEYLKKMT